MSALGPRHAEVRRLRELLRDRSARREAGATAIEGPKVLEGALDRGAAIDAVYLAPDARRAFAGLVARVVAHGIRIFELKEGVLERIGTTVTPQPVAAIAAAPILSARSVLALRGFLVVGVGLQDPGNVGTILRSAEAAGSAGVVLTGGSVDVFHPKVVRASAGAIFGVAMGEVDDARILVRELRGAGVRTLGTALTDGTAYDKADLTGAVAVFVGNEGQGLPDALAGELDGAVMIPMDGAAESLNVGVAASILCFEASRRRRNARPPGTGAPTPQPSPLRP